ncbi:MAG TPA: protein kinase [Planktothrix sp.]
MLSTKVDSRIPWKLCICCNGEFAGDLSNCPSDGTVLKLIKNENLVGTVFADKYEILDVIGGGGMGVVYKAKHNLLNRNVAIKVLHKKLLSDVVGLKRFKIEGQAASSLSSPHIITIYDFGASYEGLPFMVMDYLEGHTLSELLEEQGRLSIERAVPIFIQICSALAHAHGKGIIHRDIKPSNIMLIELEGQSDYVKIVDFGIAKLMSRESESRKLTRTGELFGSALYMSPEQCQGEKFDHRADIYALGSVMYQVLTGRAMFVEKDILQLIYRHVMESPASFESLGLNVPKELEEIVFKALAKNKNDRYQSMHELMMALEWFQKWSRTHCVGAAPSDTMQIAAAAKPVSSQSHTIEMETPPQPSDALPETLVFGDEPIAIGKTKEETIQIVIEKRTVAAAGIIVLLFCLGGAIGYLLATPPNIARAETTKKAPVVTASPQVAPVTRKPVAAVAAEPEKTPTAVERHQTKRTVHRKHYKEVASNPQITAPVSMVSPKAETPKAEEIAPLAAVAAPDPAPTNVQEQSTPTADKHRFAGFRHALHRLIPKL